MLLLVEINAISRKICGKKYEIWSFGAGVGKIIIALLIEIVIGYLILMSIDIKKAYLKKSFLRTLCRCGFGFYHCSNNVLYFLIWINLWLGFKACNKCYWYIRKTCRWNLSANKFVSASKKKRESRWVGANGVGDTTLDSLRAFTDFGSHQK